MKTIRLDKIRLDGGTQYRAIQEEVVERYTEVIEDPDMPLIEVAFDGKDYWLWDGFHRYHAALRKKLKSLKCIVRPGTQRDAKWLSFSANARHGIPRTQAETRFIIATILKDKKWGKKSARAIAKHVGCDHKTVLSIKKTPKSGEIPQTPEVDNTSDRHSRPPGSRVQCAHATDEVDNDNGGIVDESYKTNHRDPDGVKDKVGNDLPEKVQDIFMRVPNLKKLIRAVDDIQAEMVALMDKKDPVIGLMNLPAFGADIKNLRSNLKAALPYALCPYCGGGKDDCKACKGRGFVGKIVYDAAPKELKS